MTQKLPLPVGLILPQLLASLERTPNLVIEAPPGASKTTRVPQALLALVSGAVVVLEPRRIAARMAARRVAAELGEQVGETVGYQVRFEDRTGPRTRLRFVTEGILTRRMLSDPTLHGVDAVLLDEFHERHLEGDLALALLKRLQKTRPQLRIVVMSATLNADPIARYLGNCPVLRSQGRQFPLTVRHLPYSAAPLHAQVRCALEQLETATSRGNVLVFLPGAQEIRRATRECEAVARRAGLLVLPLHGDLAPAEQDRAVLPSPGRKLTLATNVAESSVTVAGVNAVIDSGLLRRATYSAWTGLPTLAVSRVSQASATQRAGRAGRLGPGEVLRLYPEEDFQLRPEHDPPEIERADLSQLVLSLRSLGLRADDLAWLDAPPANALRSAEQLLDRLGATGDLVPNLARLPLHPRLGRIVLSAIQRGVGEDGCRAAAMLSLGVGPERNDLLAAMDLPADASVREQTAHLVRMARIRGETRHDDDALLLSVLSGFPDRVAKRRTGKRLLLVNGTFAELLGDPPASEFVVALDAEDRTENPLPLVRLLARVEPEWLLEEFPDRVEERSEVVWNSATDRVELVRALTYDKLVLEERRGNAPDAEAAARLAERVLEAGLERFLDQDAYAHFTARLAFAELPEPEVRESLRNLCTGLHSFADFGQVADRLIPLLEQQANPQRLAALAPVSVRLPGGRQTRIHYEPGRPPWIQSRLQDFFGMQQTPRIGPHNTPLVIHLLAPNQRAVQTTTDLAGFWQRLYPTVRRELMRRYPKHAWPETPA